MSAGIYAFGAPDRKASGLKALPQRRTLPGSPKLTAPRGTRGSLRSVQRFRR
ncbi:hypothetical protein [Lysobacter gummosus]|uniref:hypothetical protein n=1 Tax=Lysobacter gummosus TaxID=262324 RepID=UPI003634EF9E